MTHATLHLERLLTKSGEVTQPALHGAVRDVPPIAVVVGSLAIGGAERIVLDWMHRNANRYQFRLLVLKSIQHEWPVPENVHVVRVADGANVSEVIEAFARETSAAWLSAGFGKPSVLCHITKAGHRSALERGGVIAVPVMHNAQQGWGESVDDLAMASRLVAVSQACADELARLGRVTGVQLIRHIPSALGSNVAERALLRARLCATVGIDPGQGTKLMAMIGGVKPQKNFLRAVQVLARLAAAEDCYLVIFGRPIGSQGQEEWQRVRGEILRLGVEDRVRVTGFVPHAAAALRAFDVFLNTSHFEGLSMATLEAMLAQVPVVASEVGGQGEVATSDVQLLPREADVTTWAEAVRLAWDIRPRKPSWAGFPAHRLWSMESLACDRPRRAHVVFVTANLNAGGAQRSLVNLAKALCGKLSFEVVVAGPSSSDVFRESLEASGIKVTVSGLTRDCFDHAEALMAIAAQTGCKVMCFWNLDPKVKLLLAKALPRAIDVVDISPGGYAFEEMEQASEFQDLAGFHQVDYYRRLSKLVLKFDGDAPSYVSCETMVIRNGVPAMFDGDIERSHPSVVINGRIAPSKFLLEIVQAMSAVWSQAPEVQLHILGSVEERHRNYAEDVICAAKTACGEEVDSRVTFHGPVYDLGSVARPGDIAVVLGEHQGCPNAVLEAMSLGMAVVANDSGGTREMVKDGETGLLLPSTSVAQLSSAILRLLQDAGCRLRLAEEGRHLVRRDFSMERMARSYGDFFQSMFTTDTSYEADHRR